MSRLQTRVSNKLAITLGGHAKFLDSPTPHLITCNDSPSDDEHRAVEEAIMVVEARLNDGKVLASPGYPYHSQPLVEYIRIHRSILAPVRRLPNELLGEIFFQCLEKNQDPCLNNPPWKIGHICHRWRQVALGTAGLWRHLPPLARNKANTNTKGRIACIESLLQRSRNAGITFFIEKSITPDDDDAILVLLFKHCDRWENISLVLSEAVCAHFCRVQGRLPSLKRLKLRVLRQSRLHVNFFDNTPNLTEVDLSSKPWAGDVCLPWGQLKVFNEVTSDFRHLGKVLAEAHDLEKLGFEFHQDWSITNIATGIPPTTLNHLSSLSIQCTSDTSIHKLLGKLTLPALEELCFRQFNIDDLTPALISLIQRSGCTMQRLTVHSFSGSVDMKEVLKATPFLSSLDTNNIDPDFVRDLSAADDGGVGWALVPNLVKLTIRLRSGSDRLKYVRMLAKARCDLCLPPSESPGTTSTPVQQNLTRLVDLFLVTPCTLHYLDETGFAGLSAAKLILDEEIRQLKSFGYGYQAETRKEREAKRTQRLNYLFDMIERFATDEAIIPYFYYERTNSTLWQLIRMVPLGMHQKLQFHDRFDALLMKWAQVLKQSSSTLKWIWQENGYLRYASDLDDRRYEGFNLRTFVLPDKSPAKDDFGWPADWPRE